MPAKPKVEYNIDLQCSLCPKNPKFSDVSHLLTHIASKGHLAHRFKLQIRAQNEPDAKQKLDHFDFWYRTSNLDALLSERLAAKDQKKTKKSKAPSSNPSIKQENELSLQPNTSAPAAPMYRAPVPAMQLWPAATAAHRTPSAAIDEWESSVYSTPTARRAVPNFTRAETPIGNKVDPSLTTPWKPFADNDDDDEGEKKSSEKLKGAIWPGMDLFDSATPLMKRQRNQKKDSNVLEAMIATSEAVEPAEVSYHANGQFRASRDIFGPLSDEDSPSRSVTPKRRRATRRAAATLNDLSINAPRLRAPRGRKGAPNRDPEKSSVPPSTRAGHMFLQPAHTLNPLAAGLNNPRFHPTADEDEEFRLTVGGFAHQGERKKRAFNVFQEAPQNSPARTESPLEDDRFDYTNHGLPTTQGLPAYTGPAMPSGGFQHSPTPLARPAMFGFGKENGQMDMHNHHQRRTLSDSFIYPSQVFYDTSYNPLYNHAYARSLTYSTQYTFSENKSPGSLNTNMLGAPSHYKFQVSHRSQSPQAQGRTTGSGNNPGQNGEPFGQ